MKEMRSQECFYLTLKKIFTLRKRESTGEGGARREGERESQAGSALSAQSPMRGLNSQTVRSWPEQKSDAYKLTELLRHPKSSNIFKKVNAKRKKGKCLKEHGWTLELQCTCYIICKSDSVKVVFPREI